MTGGKTVSDCFRINRNYFVIIMDFFNLVKKKERITCMQMHLNIFLVLDSIKVM